MTPGLRVYKREYHSSLDVTEYGAALTLKIYSCNQFVSRFTRRFNLTRHKDSRCKHITVIKGFVREVSTNNICEQVVPIKRLLNDSAELNAADKTNKPFKNPNIHSLLDEIINDSSPEKSPSTISQAIPQNASVIQKKIPKPPSEIAAYRNPHMK